MKNLISLMLVLALAVTLTGGLVCSALAESDEAVFVFEFEDLNFTGRKGAGLSGAANGLAMILCGNSEDLDIPEDYQPSNDYYVSYTYSANSYDFEIESTVETDARITLRLNSEIGIIQYDKTAFAVVVNGETLDYKPFSVYPIPNIYNVTDPHYFTDYTLSVKLHLVAGSNIISVQTLDNTLLNGSGFAAPQLDCIKLRPDDTSAVLTFANMVEGNYDE